MDRLDMSRDNDAPIGSQAFVRVMRGCDNFCTYCVVPYVRGPECCKEPRLIVEEVGRLVDAATDAVKQWKFQAAQSETTEVVQLTFETH